MSKRQDLIDILKLGRFHFLFGGFLIYSLGALIAVELGGEGDVLKFLFGYAVFFPAHLSVSYSNDLYDISADKFNSPSPFSGGSGVLQRKPELAPIAKTIAIGLILLSISLSIVFMFIYQRTLFFPLLVLSGALLGWAYTSPPFRLAYRRLGEVATVTAVGLLVLFMGYFVMYKGSLSIIVYFLFPQLLYGIQFITSVQIPDREADRKGGKTTMVVLYGRRISFILLFISTLLATLFYFSFWVLRIGPVWRILGVFCLLSLIPLTASIPSIILRPALKRPATVLVTISMASMFAFLILANLYLVFGR
ncbi:MAG: prenyltransferase [Candidatus Thermoplasmatota archaeon]|nr:prenyltransferase [Candidatus Thermoplasmatota archaeon]